MKKASIIISMAEVTCGILESQQCHTFDTPAEAKAFILRNLEAESSELDTPLEKDSGDIMSMFRQVTEGNFSYTVGDHEYHIAFLKVPGEYNVSDDEMANTLEAFVNTGRSVRQYEKMAGNISLNMHRACQNELWRFVKAIIRAFANGRYDRRNETAHDQAELVAGFMDEKRF